MNRWNSSSKPRLAASASSTTADNGHAAAQGRMQAAPKGEARQRPHRWRPAVVLTARAGGSGSGGQPHCQRPLPQSDVRCRLSKPSPAAAGAFSVAAAAATCRCCCWDRCCCRAGRSAACAPLYSCLAGRCAVLTAWPASPRRQALCSVAAIPLWWPAALVISPIDCARIPECLQLQIGATEGCCHLAGPAPPAGSVAWSAVVQFADTTSS